MIDAQHRKNSVEKDPDDSTDRLRQDSITKPNHAANADRKQASAADSDTLTKKGILPKVEVTTPKKWTIAVELGATLPGGKFNADGFGADSKLKKLKSLAKETEGKSVNFLVEVERTKDSKGNACHLPGRTASGSGKCDADADKKGLVKTERYFIHDGKIEKLADSTAKSAADEIKELVHDATKLSPSSNIGLIIQSHGMGPEGIHTNRGNVSVDNIADSIKKGLKGSGREKLDVLDFDACSMSSLPVLDKISKVSAHVVSSESEEGAGSKSGTRINDGQNMKSELQGLLHNPDQTPSEFASSLVKEARGGENGTGKGDSTLTLTHFDMSKYREFKGDLNQFGAQLAKTTASGDRRSVDAIKQAVDDSTSPQTGPDQIQAHERDLKSFTENILRKIHSGELRSPNGSLEKAATKFLASLSSLTPDNFGEKALGFDKLGGLTTSIPGGEVLDRKVIGRLASPLHKVSSDFEKMQREGLTLKDKKPALELMKQSIDEMHHQLRGLHGEPSKAFYASLHKIAGAKTEAEFQASLKEFQKTVSQAEDSKVGKMLAHGSERASIPLYQDYKHSKVASGAPAWDAFIARLEKSRR